MLLQNMIRAFAEDGEKKIGMMKAGYSHKEKTMIAHAAHAIKASSGNYGAQALYLLAEKIETRAEKDLHQDLSDDIASLERLFKQVILKLNLLMVKK